MDSWRHTLITQKETNGVLNGIEYRNYEVNCHSTKLGIVWKCSNEDFDVLECVFQCLRLECRGRLLSDFGRRRSYLHRSAIYHVGTQGALLAHIQQNSHRCHER